MTPMVMRLNVVGQEECVLEIPGVSKGYGYIPRGWYAVAIQIEDFARTTISIGGSVYQRNRPISSIPLQFLVTAVSPSSGSNNCSESPKIVNASNIPEVISLDPEETFNTTVCAEATDSQFPILEINIVGPVGVWKSNLMTVSTLVKCIAVRWKPVLAQKGQHTFCFDAININFVASDPVCTKVIAYDKDECLSFPCQNRGTCINLLDKYKCGCLEGFSEEQCQKVDGSVGTNCTQSAYCSNVNENSTCSPSGQCVCKTDFYRILDKCTQVSTSTTQEKVTTAEPLYKSSMFSTDSTTHYTTYRPPDTRSSSTQVSTTILSTSIKTTTSSPVMTSTKLAIFSTNYQPSSTQVSSTSIPIKTSLLNTKSSLSISTVYGTSGSTSNEENEGENDRQSEGGGTGDEDNTVGIVMGVVGGVLAAALLVGFIIKKKKHNRVSQKERLDSQTWGDEIQEFKSFGSTSNMQESCQVIPQENI